LQFAHRTAIAKLAMVPSSPDESDHLLHDARAAGLLVSLTGPALGGPVFSASSVSDGMLATVEVEEVGGAIESKRP
jgi:hypothetical protein